jgi:hypothetical protein
VVVRVAAEATITLAVVEEMTMIREEEQIQIRNQ